MAVPPLTVSRAAVGAANSHLGPADYAVAFRLEPQSGIDWCDASAEQWLRYMFEDAPAPLRCFLLVGWAAITCRLGFRRSSAVILGWRIEGASQDRAVISVDAWIGLTSRLVLALDEHGVTVESLVSFTRPRPTAARVVWALTTPLHERILPYLLRQAARRQMNRAAA
jgi:hypothetical protein